MPELPEVETVCRTLRPALLGRRIARVEVFERRLRTLVDLRRLRRIALGSSVAALRRRGKYILLELVRVSAREDKPAGSLLVHLGMTGSLVLCEGRTRRPDHLHVLFTLDDGSELRYRDPRRFGMVDALAPDRVGVDRRLADLGVEPLSEEFSGAEFYRRTRGRRKPVKNFLMDAREVVGVGNIYASEALFLAGVHPRRAAGRLSRERWEEIVANVKGVLVAAIERGGTTISDFRDGGGDAGRFQHELRVYGRDDEACPRCRACIRRFVLGGRSTFYCPRCQR